MLSIDTNWSPEMREASGDCFVQVGLNYRELITAEEYLRAAHTAMKTGGDCVYCAASIETIGYMAANGIPVVGHVGLIPSKATWTGGFKAVGKTAQSALQVMNDINALEAVGAFGAELEVVPDRVAEEIARHTNLVLLGMGAGPHSDAQYLFAEDVLGCTRGHKPRHAKTYADFNAENARLQALRIKAFQAFRDDVTNGSYPTPAHSVPIEDVEFAKFVSNVESSSIKQ